MKQSTFTNKIKESYTFRKASIPNQFNDIQVVVGSEELLFEETYVTALLQNNRVVRFKKSTLVFA